MKRSRVRTLLTTLVPLVLALGVPTSPCGPLAAQGAQHGYVPPRLTSVEERDLQGLVKQALEWMLVWYDDPRTCNVDDKSAEISIPTAIEKQGGHEVEMLLRRSNSNVLVYLAPLHVKLGFERVSARGLSTPEVNLLCAGTNASAIADEERAADISRRAGQQFERSASAKAGIAPKPHSAGKAEPPPLRSLVWADENRRYRVPALSPPPVQPSAQWSAEKWRAYRRMVAALRRAISEDYCRPGAVFEVLVADFQVGDPEINVLLTDHSSGPVCLPTVRFLPDPASGTIRPVVTDKLPVMPGELDFGIRRIKRRQVTQFRVTCRGGN